MSDYKRLDKTGLTTLLTRLSEVLGSIFNGKMNTDGGNAVSHVKFSGSFTIGDRKAGKTVGPNSFSNGSMNEASSDYSHAEGYETKAIYWYTHSEGSGTTASNQAAHAEGLFTTASGENSHSEGQRTTASGKQSHAEGFYTTAGYMNQHVSGKYNSNKEDTLLEVGNGTADNARSNAIEVYSNGNVNAGADLLVAGKSQVKGIQITSSDILDNITNSGLYSFDYSSIPTGHPCPSDLPSGSLRVICNFVNTSVYQYLTDSLGDKSRLWFRRKYNGTWSTWKLWANGGIDGIEITSAGNLNDILLSGIYKWSDLSLPTNAPVTNTGAMTVMESGSSGSGKTIFQFVITGTRIFCRRTYNGTWYDWDEFISNRNLNTMMKSTDEDQTLWKVVKGLCASVKTATTYPLQNFAIIAKMQSTITFTATSSSITSTQTSSYHCYSVAGNKTDGIDLTLYSKMNITASNSGTTYGSPNLRIGLSDTVDALQVAADGYISTGSVTNAAGYLNFTTTSSTVYTFDISHITGIKYIMIVNSFTKYTITKIELTN